MHLSTLVLGARFRHGCHTCAGPCVSVASVFEHQINELVSTRSLIITGEVRLSGGSLWPRPALLVELDCVARTRCTIAP